MSGAASKKMRNTLTSVTERMGTHKDAWESPELTSKVAHDELELVGLDDLGDLVGNSLNAHLGLLIVGRDLGRRDHVSDLVLELLLDTTAECDRDKFQEGK